MRFSLLVTAVGILGSFTYLNVTETCGCNGPEDIDGDGYCEPDDCNTTNADVFPGAPELCDGVDNDCNGAVPADEADKDGDGFKVCEGDCDDTDPKVKPGGIEICDGKDNNCDGTLGSNEADADGDGVPVCAPDCDDNNDAMYPGAPEDCDGLDNDCDGVVPSEEADQDGDGVASCESDCDDSNDAVYPGATETCNGLDDDCDFLSDVSNGGQSGWTRSVCQAVLQGTSGSFDANGVDQIFVLYNFDKGLFEAWYRGTDASKIQRIGYASSVDGVSWTKRGTAVIDIGATGALDAKAVAFPTVVYRNGTYILWYHGTDANNKNRIFRANSTNGTTWTKVTTAALEASTTTGAWDSRAVSSPTVVFDEDTNTYKMWYSGNDGTNLRIGYAYSADGTTWTRATSWVLNVGSTGDWDDKRVVFPRVLKDRDTYHMYYAGDDSANTYTYEVGYAVSIDGGASFEKAIDPALSPSGTSSDFDSFMVYAGQVLSVGDGYSMYYSGAPTFDGPFRIGLARNFGPTINVIAPGPEEVARAGEPITFEAQVSDVGDDHPLSALFISDVDGLIGYSSAPSGGTITFTVSNLSVGDHRVHMVVSDRGGLSAHEVFDVTIY